MNVGIFTHCVADNFGANLQAISTGVWLREHGYNPIYIQWNDYLPINDTISDQSSMHRNFLKKYGFTITEPCITDEDFLKVIEDHEMRHIVVGSDCVLTYENPLFPFKLTRKGFKRMNIASDFQFPNPFWMPFLSGNTDVHRYMISASSGSSNYRRIGSRTKIEMRKLLSQYDFLSVRDTNAANMVKYIMNNRMEVRKTPDPVFGFPDESLNIPTKAEIMEKYRLPQNYYVVSFYENKWPTQQWINDLCAISNKHGIKCVSVPMPQGGKRPELDINIELPLDTIDWYCLIKYSNGFIGNNMHPIIVCMHNAVPFFSFNIHGRFYLRGRIQTVKSSKEYDILNRFGLLKYQIPQIKKDKITARQVIDIIDDFDKDDRIRISKILQSEYNSMMNDVKMLIDRC